MLPGLGFSEIIVLAVIALLVIGPKDLPNFLRMLGRWTRKMQSMAAEFRQGFDELARQAELDELRQEVEAMRRAATPLSDIRQHASDIHRDVMNPIDPAASPIAPAPGEIEAAMEAEPVIPENFDAPAPASHPTPPAEPAAEPSAVEARG